MDLFSLPDRVISQVHLVQITNALSHCTNYVTRHRLLQSRGIEAAKKAALKKTGVVPESAEREMRETLLHIDTALTEVNTAQNLLASIALTGQAPPMAVPPREKREVEPLSERSLLQRMSDLFDLWEVEGTMTPELHALQRDVLRVLNWHHSWQSRPLPSPLPSLRGWRAPDLCFKAVQQTLRFLIESDQLDEEELRVAGLMLLDTVEGYEARLTLDDEEGLAVLPQREKRELPRRERRKNPTKAQLALHLGDTVEVTRDLGDVETRKVRTEPWQLPNGYWLIGLEGISGGYDLLRCQPVKGAKA